MLHKKIFKLLIKLNLFKKQPLILGNKINSIKIDFANIDNCGISKLK
jgi:hypothetical protein